MLKHINLPELNLNEVANLETKIRVRLSQDYGLVELDCLSKSVKSQVWLMKAKKQKLIIKRHSSSVNYFSEKFAYLVLDGGNIPFLMKTYDEENILVLQFLQGSKTNHDLDICYKATKQLAKLHSTGYRNIIEMTKDEENLPHFYKIYTMLGGDNNNSYLNKIRFSIGDLKPEHIIMVSNEIYFIDLETFSFSLNECFDLSSLWINTIGIDNTKNNLRDLISLYFFSLPNSDKLDKRNFCLKIKYEIFPFFKENWVSESKLPSEGKT